MMFAAMRLASAALLLSALALTAAAAPQATRRGWQGVTPGVSTGAEVTARFGPPSTEGKAGARSAIVYKDEEAISGTRQAQFFLRPDGVVQEVVVFPASQLDRETVEGTYGKPSKKAFTDDFKTVWFFRAAGIAVFFDKEGLVEAISFRLPDAAAPAGTSG